VPSLETAPPLEEEAKEDTANEYLAHEPSILNQSRVPMVDEKITTEEEGDVII